MKMLLICGVVLAGVMVVGCDTFSDLVPGITDSNAEIALLRADLEALADSDDPADVEMSKRILSRVEKMEEWGAWVEAEIDKRQDEKIDVWSLADIGIKVAAGVGVPGMGLLGLFLRRAKRTTATVVSTIEANKNGDGTVNWAQLRSDQEAAGVHEIVRGIRKAEAAKIAAASAAVAVT